MPRLSLLPARALAADTAILGAKPLWIPARSPLELFMSLLGGALLYGGRVRGKNLLV
jgi:hypothetical protein